GKGALLGAKEVIQSKFGVSMEVHAVDLSKGNEARALAEACPDIDIMVNNAGAIPSGDLWQVDEKKWREAWDLKVFGYINLCRAVFPQMQKRGKGVIINVIGGAGERPNRRHIAGGAGNAALMAFTKAMGAKSMRDNIRIVGINPGLIKTARLEELMRSLAKARFNDAERWKELLPSDPPPGNPEDIANMVAFLSSDLARYITGTIVTVDGGATAS
ncbi:MAG: SDR family oxidoreductase, partial [Deltaproteobacteria bacterium]|nr:SDR family oxidoreductase [Deltaproteobacteria bacterium]